MNRIVVIALSLLALSCGGKGDDAPVRYGFAPISAQGGVVQTSFAGTIDPTNPFWSGGMATCSSSCGAPLAEQNRIALKTTLDYAGTHSVRVYLPPGNYPVGCASGQTYGIDTTGDSNVTIEGYGATLRFTGSAADCSMLQIRNGSGWSITGVTFSGRDATSVTTSTNLVKIGDGGATTIDNVALYDTQFVEGTGGDFVRLDGGTSTYTVTRVSFKANRMENAARAAINIRPGVAKVSVLYNFFRNNVNRDVWVEDTGDGPIGQVTISYNFMERPSSSNAAAVTLSGHGGANSQEQSVFSFNRVTPVIGSTTGGGVVECSGFGNGVIQYNLISVNRATSTPNISCSGKVYDTVISDNFVERKTGASSAAVISLTSSGSVGPTDVIVRANRALQYSGTAPGIDLSGAIRSNVTENNITYHASTGDSGATGFVGIYCAGTSAGICSGNLSRNRVKRDDQDIKASLDLATKTTNDNTVVQARLPGTQGNSLTIAFVGDSGSTAGSIVDGTTSVTVHYRPAFTTVANVETLLAASGLVEVKTTGTAANVLQVADAFAASNLAGAVAAGRPLAGIEILKGTGTTAGSLTLRDNWFDGPRASIYSDLDGSAAYPSGYPLVSGNQSANVTNEFEGGITTYRTETTSDAETVSSGALAIAKRVSFLSTTGTVAYTLADGANDGFVKWVRVKTSASTPAGTLTPTHLADGTTHTYTWTTCNSTTLCWICLTWDATNTTWRECGHAAAVTLN
jgi:hypothetical protein